MSRPTHRGNDWDAPEQFDKDQALMPEWRPLTPRERLAFINALGDVQRFLWALPGSVTARRLSLSIKHIREFLYEPPAVEPPEKE